VNYWQRIGTALTPATVNDRIEVVSSDTGPIVGEYTGTVNDGRAMLGQATGATGETIGVEGVCASADNAAYEGKFPRVVSDNWHDMGESSNTPLSDAPEAGYVRAIAGDDGRLYAIDSDANRHDLTQRTPHYFAGWTAAQNAATGKTWDSLKYPATAVAIGTVTASNTGGFDFTNEGGLTSFGRWTWQANVVFADPDYIQSNQSQVAVWSPFGRQGDNNDNCRVYVQARIRVNTVANFDNVYLVVNDVTTADVLANTAKSADQLGSMSDGVWYIATLAAAGTDVGGWNECLRAGVWAQGASEVALEDITLQLDIDWIKVYMYAD